MARVTRQAYRLLGLLVAMVVARFLRETQLCAQLYHPNIVSLINACKTTSGRDMQPPLATRTTLRNARCWAAAAVVLHL